eukprot:Gb_39163 [translate_table: standard]
MAPRSSSRKPRALRELHGVQLVHHTSFQAELSSKGEFQFSNSMNSESPGNDRRLLMQLEDIDRSKISATPWPHDHFRRMWQQRPACLRPVQCNHQGDQNLAETIANVLTSIPFIFLGIQTPRKRTRNMLYANSLVGVGIASSLYHSSRGEVRKYFKWADYAMIATTTVCLSRALRNDNPRMLLAASAVLLPFQPLIVSAVHTGLMEVAFARRVVLEPELKKAHNLHTASSVVGGALFIADDLFPQTPYLHAAWHLAAVVGVATCNKLLE